MVLWSVTAAEGTANTADGKGYASELDARLRVWRQTSQKCGFGRLLDADEDASCGRAI
jgi:hypothetical protein